MRWFNPRISDRVAIFMTFGPCGTGNAAIQNLHASWSAARPSLPIKARDP
jgi:hypothetical protein